MPVLSVADQTGTLSTTMLDDGSIWNGTRFGGIDPAIGVVSVLPQGIVAVNGVMSSGPVASPVGKSNYVPDVEMTLVSYPTQLVSSVAPLLGTADPEIVGTTSALAGMIGAPLVATNDPCGIAGLLAMYCIADFDRIPASVAPICPALLIGSSQAITFPAADAAAGTMDRPWPTSDFDVTAAVNDSASAPASFPGSNNPNLNVTFTSSTPAVCTVAGVPGPSKATIHPVVAGTCRITAHSGPLPRIAPAPDVTRIIQFGDSQVITFPAGEPGRRDRRSCVGNWRLRRHGRDEQFGLAARRLPGFERPEPECHVRVDDALGMHRRGGAGSEHRDHPSGGRRTLHDHCAVGRHLRSRRGDRRECTPSGSAQRRRSPSRPETR